MSSNVGFADWIGREQAAQDRVTASLVERFRATLPLPDEMLARPIPLGLHWCLAPIIEPLARLGDDGHPALGIHLPNLPFSRRMWASGTLELRKTLSVGDAILRQTRIESIEQKTGRSGDLAFVTIGHRYRSDDTVAVEEKQILVYRNESASKGNLPTPRKAAASEKPVFSFKPDPVMLFRYSALTFNGHRIHYDHPYATIIEGHRGIVVHAPLMATMVANIAASIYGSFSSMDFRAVSPAIAGERLEIFSFDQTEGSLGFETVADGGRLIMSTTIHR